MKMFGTSYVDVYDDSGWRNTLATHDEEAAFDEFQAAMERNAAAARLRSRSGFRMAVNVMSAITAILCLVFLVVYVIGTVGDGLSTSDAISILIWTVMTGMWTVFAIHLTRPVTLLCAIHTEDDDDESIKTKDMEIGVHEVDTDTPSHRTEGSSTPAVEPSHTSDSEATTVISPHPLEGDGQSRSTVTQSNTAYMVMSGGTLSKLVNGLKKTETIPTYTSTPVEAGTPSDTPSNVSEDDSSEEPVEKVEQTVAPSDSTSIVFDDTVDHPVVTDDQVDDSIEEPETEQDETEQESTEEPVEESSEDESQDELLFRKRRRVIYKGELPKRYERLRRYIHSITHEDDGTWTVVYTDVDNVDNADTKSEMWGAIRDRVERIDEVRDNG